MRIQAGYRSSRHGSEGGSPSGVSMFFRVYLGVLLALAGGLIAISALTDEARDAALAIWGFCFFAVAIPTVLLAPALAWWSLLNALLQALRRDLRQRAARSARPEPGLHFLTGTQERLSSARCPVCGDGLAGSARLARCAFCATPHHHDCFEFNGGQCGLFGCDGGRV